ncbi:MAG: nucleotidyltransferase domain-containing protein [Defluviitaleaceae bacterium]|nr:nucleotidyltransferase domain-containing protein [Defluviitaleaceae bacterium]
MLTHEKIVEAVQKAAKEFPLVKAEYFGSYADGCATEDSDLDLLVEYDEVKLSILKTIALKHFLEDKLSKRVDVVEAPLPYGSMLDIGKTVSVL